MSAMASPGLYSDLFVRRLVPLFVEWSCSPDLRLSLKAAAALFPWDRFASADLARRDRLLEELR